MSKAVQTVMKLFMGKTPNVNAYNQIEYPMWVPKVVTTIVDLTLVAKDSGTIYVNTAATEANINFTLPAIADGPYFFIIMSGAATGMTITAETVNTLVAFNDLTATSVSLDTSAEIIGGGFIIVCDATSVFALPLTASHAQTITVA